MAELATIARPYAEALFEVARKGDLNQWAEQIDALAQIASNEELRQFADNPKVSASTVFDVIAEAARLPLLDGLKNFLRMLIDNGRLDALPAVTAQFHALKNAQSGVADAKVYSAFPIESAQLGELVQALEKRFGRKLQPSVEVDPDLIGGVRVVVGDEVLDTSVKARLDRMKVALTA